MADFDIVHELVEVPRTSGGRVRKVFYPADGHNCAIVYIEANANGAAILAKLAEIEALSTDYKKYQWQAEALSGDYRPSVDVRVTVRDNVPLP